MRVVGDGGWLACVVARAWRAYGGVVATACVMGPVVGVLSWSSGCGATP